MLELIAQGTKLDFRWRRQIPPDTPFVLGRTTTSFKVPWDSRVSRSHVRLRLVEGKLLVQKLDEASNPVFFNGCDEETFWLQPGEHFVIGNTTFTLTKDQAHVTLDVPNPISQKTFSVEYLRNVHYRDADHRIDVLNRLPDVISSAGNEQDLMNRMVNTLLAGITSASTIGIVRQKSAAAQVQNAAQPGSTIEVIHWDRRGELSGDFQPSEKLILQAVESLETVLHVWRPSGIANPEFTFDYENNWAFVCPIDSSATAGWGIYVTGANRSGANAADSGSDGSDLQGDIKFCELVGSTLKNLLLVKQLERRQASFRSFFSPIVLDALTGRDPEEVLAPQQCMVSVLFCDLRGFARTSEIMADELFKLLNRVSSSLDVVTSKILQHGGVIGDFHGDSAMGFWGWPLTQPDTAQRAIAAALDIQAEFRSRQSGHPGFQIGIGIATGMAVAGKIGTRDQVKVTVFGPVVNLASRLEGMTRWLNSSILVERATIDQLHKNELRTRQLGRFQPFGMTSTIEVVQLLDESDQIDSQAVEKFELALQNFQAGEWQQALKRFNEIPASDSARQFLVDFIQQHGGTPPTNWRGVIEMKSK